MTAVGPQILTAFERLQLGAGQKGHGPGSVGPT